MSWPVARLTDVCSRITDGTHQAPKWAASGIPFLFVSNVRNGSISFDTDKFVSLQEYEKLTKHCPIEPDDVLYTAVGSYGNAAVVPTGKTFIFQRHIAHIKPRHDLIDAAYLSKLLEAPLVRRQADRMARGIAQKTVTLSSLKDFEIPLPPLDEQKRIAAILDNADQVRQKRRQAIALLDSLTQSIFLEMFGDPVSNPKGLKQVSLKSIAKFTSGGTPSKAIPAFWTGNIPWVSPKDMKVEAIYDAEDHVSESALEQTTLKMIKADTILIVVRGMILAHTAPIAITKRPVTINQDMKAISFSSLCLPLVGFWNLKVQADHILSKIATAAHGTKKLDMDILESLPVLIPSPTQQSTFVSAANKLSEAHGNQRLSYPNLDSLFSSVQHRAFTGQL